MNFTKLADLLSAIFSLDFALGILQGIGIGALAALVFVVIPMTIFYFGLEALAALASRLTND